LFEIAFIEGREHIGAHPPLEPDQCRKLRLFESAVRSPDEGVISLERPGPTYEEGNRATLNAADAGVLADEPVSENPSQA
jgi:hypothetical protein